jgi:antitoxin (DNA-binding transcriptional repressor) of toxin-antitoxin stability system
MKMTSKRAASRAGTEVTISASEFKARCLTLFDRLADRKLRRVIVTKRGKPVAELVPPRARMPDLWGAMKGTVTIAPGVDLTAPVLDEDEFDAAKGILLR